MNHSQADEAEVEAAAMPMAWDLAPRRVEMAVATSSGRPQHRHHGGAALQRRESLRRHQSSRASKGTSRPAAMTWKARGRVALGTLDFSASRQGDFRDARDADKRGRL